MTGPLPFSDACERNREPILAALREVLPARGRVLEIGACTGQHVVHFARALPALQWQPTDRSEYLPGLAARLEAEGGPNVLAPLELDVTGRWPEGPFDAVYSANTAHIMAWSEVRCMFQGVARVLVAGGVFCLYGPFNENGEFTAPGNAAFDQALRQRDPAMGLRDVDDLESLGRERHLVLERRFPMPANNQVLVFAAVGPP